MLFLPVLGIVSVPLPGFSGLRLETLCLVGGDRMSPCFSPVAGIQWVETFPHATEPEHLFVSVPLPGFSGLRPR